MTKLLILLLALFLLLPAASAADVEAPYDSSAWENAEVSDWARADVLKTIELNLGLDWYDYNLNLRRPIDRGDFAVYAAALVATEFGSNLEGYRAIMSYRGEIERKKYFRLREWDIVEKLGIMIGRGGSDLDTSSPITRQEAAVVLARTYRAYQDTMPDTLQPLPFVDQEDIADWALDDVRLMNQLGVMTGVGNGNFDPEGIYTVEQCLVTLLRLHEKAPYDGSKKENPFAIPVWEKGFSMIRNEGDTISLLFVFETEDYYICGMDDSDQVATIGKLAYEIRIIDQDFTLRSYQPVILLNSSYRGPICAIPEHPALSEDGTKLIYTAKVDKDAYHYNFDGKKTLIFLKGIYTVTMDLKTGEQTYTRVDLP